ncbi:MAG: glycosyltransferase, partial [Vicinamibacterales bacterium]
MTLSIVIVSYNARADLERCLASLTVHPPAIPHDIVVVDNASSDDSVAAVRRGWPGVTVITQPLNRGFAHANNVGIRVTSGALVLLLNSDTI